MIGRTDREEGGIGVRKIGMVTIGQSPRNDVLSVMGPHLPRGVRVLQRGALDDFDGATVKELEPVAGQTLLVTVMRDGTEVRVAREKIAPLMQKAVDELVREGVECIVVLCTGGFEDLRADRLILLPGRLARGLIRSLASETGTRVGVVLPSAEQIPGEKEALRQQWGGLDVFVTSASPYTELETRKKEWKRAAEELRQAKVDIVYLNCMGMDEEMKRVVQEGTRKPVILASSIAARVVGELVGS